MTDIPAGFSIVQPTAGAAAPAVAAQTDIPAGFNVVDPKASPTDWHRGTLAPVEHNQRTGEWRLAVPGVVQSIWDAVTLPGEVAANPDMMDPRVPYSQTDPATLNRATQLSAALASELPLASRNMVSPTVGGMVDAATGARMPTLVASELADAGVTPATLQSEISRLGPAGMVGDVTPRLQARTAAVARVPGPGQDMITQALMERAAGANGRIKGALDATFGGEPIPSQVTAAIDQARKTANAAYEPVFAEKALSGSTPEAAQYNAQPLADAINAAVPNFVGDTRSKVASVGKMLIDPSTGKLTTDPQIILAVRGELDGMIGELKDQRGSKTTIGALGDLRKMIDEDLAHQVPGIKWADAGRAEVAAQEGAFQTGRDVLKGGTDPIHPVDLQTTLDELKGPKGTAIGPRSEPSLAPLRLSQGTLSKIYETVGTTANDRVALKQILKGEGSWNRDKLATVFGEDKAKALIDLLDAEAQMARTENMAIGNSVTSTVEAAKAGIEPRAGKSGFIENALNLDFGKAARNVADAATGGLSKSMRDKNNAKIAAALLSNGGWVAGKVGSSGVPQVVTSAVLQTMLDRAKRGGMLNFDPASGGGGY